MHEIITDNLDLWTSALLTKSTAGRGSNGKQEAYGIKKLRALILELAVRGKLVPQDPNDEPASELLKHIHAEKAKLIAEGKIKKDNLLPTIDEGDKPFESPQGWEWVRLGEIAEIIRGVTYSKSDARDKPLPNYVPLLRGNNINRVLNFDELVYVPKQLLNDAQYIKAGDIVIAMSSGSADLVGKAAQATDNIEGGFGAFCGVVRSLSAKVFNFFGFFFQTPLYKIRAAGHGKGIGINNLQKTALQTLEVPLPPLPEQRRIVAKVNELMALCDQLEQQQTNSFEAHQKLVEILLGMLTSVVSQEELTEAWDRIASHFDTLFTTEHSIDQLKQTILQLAVMGKLVPQDPNDESARVLLEKISAEKDRLASEGVIKKQESLKKVTDLDKPFEIPAGWEWTRLGNVGVGSTGKTPSTRKQEYYGGEVQFIGPGQITPNGKILESNKTLTEAGCEYSVVAEPGDIMMVCIGGSIGKSAIMVSKVAFNQQINCIRPILVSPVLLYHLMNTSQFQAAVLEKASGSATPIINRSKWEELVVPLPPEAEQHRIVAKVDELMALCNALKARLADTQTIQVHLADAIVEQAIA